MAVGLFIGAVALASSSITAIAVPRRQDLTLDLTDTADAQTADAAATSDAQTSDAADTANAQTSAIEATTTSQTDAAQQTSHADQQRNPHQSSLHQA